MRDTVAAAMSDRHTHAHPRRRLAAILSADAAGFSRLMEADEEGAFRVVTAHREAIEGRIADHGGRLVATAGDGLMAEFPSAVEAVRCATGIQADLGERNAQLSPPRRMLFRIGINLGDVIVEGDDIFGDGVNLAARLQAIAEPGGIAISGNVYEQVAGRLEVGFEDGGLQQVKHIAQPVHVYRVRTAGKGAFPTGRRRPRPAAATPAPAEAAEASRFVRWKVLLIALLMGLFGGHRFYVGRKGTGVLQFLALFVAIGVFWWLYDLLMIVFGEFRDAEGRPVRNWF